MKPITFILIVALVPLSACSYFFPDKEKDYVYSKEIAVLEMPPNLRADSPQAEPSVRVSTPTLVHTIDFIQDTNASYLHINSPFAYAWRVVGKALTERSVEITDMNRSMAIYYVQYDPEKPVIEDGSFWDEVIFFFADDPHQEKPYRIVLTESAQGTDVFVQDEQGHALTQGPGLQLLNTLFEAIKKDFAG